MPVFISHKQQDSEKAAWLRSYLVSKGVPCYVDLIELGQPGLESDEALTKRIIDRLSRCTHLMAVVSEHTERSWWVPFEIGVATEKEHRISTLNYRDIGLPEYLNIWPVLVTQEHLDRYVQYYKLDSVAETVTGQKLFTDASKATIKSAQTFHLVMKKFTGQRP